jgi:hypothetical protein
MIIMQRLDLGFVNQTLFNVLEKLELAGAYLLISRAIRKLEIVKPGADNEEAHPTLSIGNNGTIYINEKFWKKEIRTETDAEFVIMHELLHHVLGDFERKLPRGDDRVHLAKDARINSFIWALMKDRGCLPQKVFTARFYRGSGPSGILRAGTKYKQTDPFFKLYKALYRRDCYYTKTSAKNPEDIYRALCELMPRKVINIVLLGSSEGEGEDSQIPPEMLDGIRRTISKELSKHTGWGNCISQLLIDLIADARSLDSSLLSRYSITQKVNKLKAMWTKQRNVRSPLPIRPSARDLAKYVLWGQMPVLWNNIRADKGTKERGVAVYLDISGSVNAHLPRILRLITNLDGDLEKIFCFSTKLVVHSLEALRRGEVDTTGGTDFTCIGEHLLEEGFRKAVIITDGYASMNPIVGEKVLKGMNACAVILFDPGANDNWFSTHYDTYKLDEVIV